ncbi:MAG: type II toxin-antitoxin system RelE/ParE family toxin [Nanoarchaeota archaeon]
MYNIIFDEEAIDFLNALPKEIKERIFKKIISAKENPLHFFERLAGRNEYKLRVGDYRIIADIDQANNKVKIDFIGHRKNVYDKI